MINTMNSKVKRYLFVHFTGETEDGEQIYFALSKDGLHWQDINNGKPVLYSSIGEKGVRDPFILHSLIDDNFYIISTDLRIASGKGWDAAVKNGSASIIIWKSKDLIEWSSPWSVELKVPGAGCVWAPEAVYDTDEDAYLVFWASKVQEPGEEKAKHRIYCSYTRDFIEFTEPEKYIERNNDVIDTTIIKEDNVYYRFSKDEITKNITMDKGEHLRGEFEIVPSSELDSLIGVEGPTIFPMEKPHTWTLLVDHFAENKGYKPLITTDISTGRFRILAEDAYDMGVNKKRHGSVLVLNEEEYERILLFFRCQEKIL